MTRTLSSVPALKRESPVAPVVAGTTVFARMLGVHDSVVRHAHIRGELWGKPFPPGFRAGKRKVMYFMSDIHEFLAQFDLHATTATETDKQFNPFAKKS